VDSDEKEQLMAAVEEAIRARDAARETERSETARLRALVADAMRDGIHPSELEKLGAYSSTELRKIAREAGIAELRRGPKRKTGQ
jgi:hypothetical protein